MAFSRFFIKLNTTNALKKTINFGIRLLIASIYVLGGWVFFQMNYTDHQRIERLKNQGIESKGVVREIHQSPMGSQPVVEFMNTANQQATFKGMDAGGLYIGAQVPIKYDPNTSEAATLSDIEHYPVSLPRSVFGSAVFCSICLTVAVYTLTSKGFTVQLR